MIAQRRLFAFDLDGTLFGADGQVSQRTRRVLATLHEAGHTLLAVSGRSFRTAEPRLRGVPGIERLVGSNGAYEYDLRVGEIRWHRPFTHTEAERWQAAIRQRFPQASFGRECPWGIDYEAAFLREAAVPADLEQSPGHAGGDTRVYKLYARTPECPHYELHRALLPVLGQEAEITTSGAPFVELSARGVDKASGLARVAADLGFAQEAVVAFGDNLNDLSMLRWAGWSVAMGNAVSEVQAVANEVAPPHQLDGVASVLERLLAS